MKTFIFGEAMLEYHSHGGTGLRYGGDTLNTAIHMARAGADVAYVTAVGTDPISEALVKAWEADGIDVSHVHRHPDRSPGMYAIHLDEHGERSFLYWRDQSAARQMFALPGMKQTLEEARRARLIYFSLISLAVVGDKGRAALIQLADLRKSAGFDVAYDSNYRPNLWPDHATARSVSREAIKSATIGLPTDEDERMLTESDETAQGIGRRWLTIGCDEVIVKAGGDGCIRAVKGQTTSYPVKRREMVDSSGAGDAFNAGFLLGHLKGAGVEASIIAAQDLAGKTVQHHGAIPRLPA